MMEISDTPKAKKMKLVAGLCALAASIGAALLWKSGGSSALPSMVVAAGVVIGTIAVAGVVTTWLRNRRRRELREMRDSALW
jgi:protein-S-isoprenylcysteine O-methyltransferase Ste14